MKTKTTNNVCTGGVLREILLHTGGEGWSAYNHLFREHAALDKFRKMDWTSLDPGLHQATFMRQAGHNGKVWMHCRKTDHQDHECALAPILDRAFDSGSSPPSPVKWGCGMRAKAMQRPETLENICISWNRGHCSFMSNCKVQHVCHASGQSIGQRNAQAPQRTLYTSYLTIHPPRAKLLSSARLLS